MKKSIASGFKMFVAVVTAFVVSASVTACVSTQAKDDAAVEQAAATEAASEGNVAVENGANTGNASQDGAGNVAASDEAALANASTGNENTASNGAAPDPFSAALNNTAQNGGEAGQPSPDASNALAGAEPPADATATGNAPAASATPQNELQTLVTESAPGAASNSVAAVPNAMDTDPFAQEKAPPSPVETPQQTETAAIPESATDNATVGGLPETSTRMPYYIQNGDTLADIATLIYGDKTQWRKLASENNIADPSRIYAGDVIFYELNEKSKTFASAYEGVSKKTVTVAKGDTLCSIAEKVLGGAQEWRTLWKMNAQIANPDRIKVGMVLTYRPASDMKKAAVRALESDDEIPAGASVQEQDTDPVFVGMAE